MGSPTSAAGATSEWRPWSQTWIDRLAIAPAWCGLGLALAHILSSVLFHAAIDATGSASPLGGGMPSDALLSTLVYALLIGYGAAGLAYARRGHAVAFDDLRPILSASETELDAARREIQRFDATWLRTVGIGAAAIATFATLFTTGLTEDLGSRNPRLIWIVWQNVLGFWLVSRAVAHDLGVSRRISRLTQQRAEVELLDQSRLAPLARRGLQSGLLIVVGVSIFSLVYGLEHLSPAVPLFQVLTIGMVGLALLLPSVGVHRRLRHAKREELARLGEELRAAKEGSADTARLAALLTLRQYTQSAREWPFDLGTLGRFSLYAGIGVGSWLGGALVERILDLVISPGP